ncbi:hypothetical protein Droror1_Dr00023551 [Drosera rotundifolia]
MPQQRSYFALQLPKRWWIFGLDLALHDDIDVYQFKFFSELIMDKGEQYAGKGEDADRALLPEQTPFYKKLAAVAVQAGWGTDEKALISVLAHHNASQLKHIWEAFKDMYSEDLIKQLKSELSGNFEERQETLEEQIEALLNVEKQMRLAGDVAGTRKAACDILQLCFEAKAWKTLNDQNVLLSKRRGQLKQAAVGLFGKQAVGGWKASGPDGGH